MGDVSSNNALQLRPLSSPRKMATTTVLRRTPALVVPDPVQRIDPNNVKQPPMSKPKSSFSFPRLSRGLQVLRGCQIPWWMDREASGTLGRRCDNIAYLAIMDIWF